MQSYRRNLVLKKTKFTLNFLTVHYLKWDQIYAKIYSTWKNPRLEKCTSNFLTLMGYLLIFESHYFHVLLTHKIKQNRPNAGAYYLLRKTFLPFFLNYVMMAPHWRIRCNTLWLQLIFNKGYFFYRDSVFAHLGVWFRQHFPTPSPLATCGEWLCYQILQN